LNRIFKKNVGILTILNSIKIRICVPRICSWYYFELKICDFDALGIKNWLLMVLKIENLNGDLKFDSFLRRKMWFGRFSFRTSGSFILLYSAEKSRFLLYSALFCEKKEEFCFILRKKEEFCFNLRKKEEFCFILWKKEEFCFILRKKAEFCFILRKKEEFCFILRNVSLGW